MYLIVILTYRLNAMNDHELSSDKVYLRVVSLDKIGIKSYPKIETTLLLKCLNIINNTQNI